MALGKILTANNLRKRGIVIMEWRLMCKMYGENANHLFSHCEMAKELWCMIFCIFGVYWVMPNLVQDMLAYWKGQGVCPRNKGGVGKLFHYA